MRKKCMAAGLVFSIVIGMLTGCAGGERQRTDIDAKTEDTEKQKLQIAVFEGGYGKEYWEKVCEAFEEENPEVEVVIQSNAEIGDVIRPTIISGNPPDFVYLPSNNISGVTRTLIQDRALTDITDVMETVEDKLLPGFLDTETCRPYGDGKVYLAPMYYSAMGLWYNKDYFEKKQYDVPETWEEFFTLGDKAKADGRALFAYQGMYPAYMEGTILSSAASSGGPEVMDACLEYEEGAWENPKIREVLDNIARIGTDGYLLEGSIFMNHTQAQAEWMLGKALFIPGGSWIENEMAGAAREEGFRFGFAAAPVSAKEDEKYVYTRIEEMYIPADAKNKDLAKKFLAFQYSDTAIRLNAQYAHGVPPVKGAVEFLKDYASEAVYESYVIYENGYRPYMGEFADVVGTNIVPRDVFYNQIGEIMSGTKAVDDWISSMEETGSQVREGKIK